MKVAFFAVCFAVVMVVQGAAVKEIEGKNRTPLHDAAKKGELEKVKDLVTKKADVNAKDGDEATPLHLASSTPNIEVVKYLVEQGADPNAFDERGRTPAHWAASSGQLDVIKYFKESTKARLLQVDDDGLSPEDLAKKAGHDKTAEYLDSLDSPLTRSMVGLM